jgi:NAD(P)-dependent dehydrogenase (short-subunit alcohol dehydrogenase family)
MRTIIITGANSGIGYETAKYLALKGNRIIAASRRKNETIKIIDNLNLQCSQSNSKGSVKFYHLDLNDLSSVNLFAKQIIAEYPTIDTLICNAGIMNSPFKTTVDGYEQQFQTNFLSHFYLTCLLTDTIIKSENPKIIHVCSASAEKGIINTINELEKISKVSEQEYDAMKSYREAKLAQQVSVMHFARIQKYKKIKFSVIHPGIVNTNLFYRNSGILYKVAMLPFVYLGYAFGFFKTPKQGAKTTIYLSENDDYESGFYWNNTKKLTPNPISNDEKYANQLYDWTINEFKKR